MDILNNTEKSPSYFKQQSLMLLQKEKDKAVETEKQELN
jgi:hypothetical protein